MQTMKPERVELAEKLREASSEEIATSIENLDLAVAAKVLDVVLTWLEKQAERTASELDDQVLRLIRRAAGIVAPG